MANRFHGVAKGEPRVLWCRFEIKTEIAVKMERIVRHRRIDMKLHIIPVCLVMIWTLQGSVVAQDWSSWTTSRRYWITSGTNNKDVQYRWRGGTPSGSEECQLQLRDLKRQPNQTTYVSVRIDYQYHNAESTRDVVTIMDVKGENQGETTVPHCTSVDDVQLADIVR
jgi:hypothetical protein